MGGCPDISEHFDLKTYVSVRVCVSVCARCLSAVTAHEQQA